jgi:hypothetical protein
MKIYSNTNVEMAYQNYGSIWLGILRGAKKDIELVFNGIYNLCGTNGKLEYVADSTAIFWTSRKAMEKFFFNRYYHPRYVDENDANDANLRKEAKTFAKEQMDILTCNGHERFFSDKDPTVTQFYSVGKISAENPDYGFKDSVLFNAFKNQESVVDTK